MLIWFHDAKIVNIIYKLEKDTLESLYLYKETKSFYLLKSAVPYSIYSTQCIIEFGRISKLFSSTKVLSVESIAFFTSVLVNMLTLK